MTSDILPKMPVYWTNDIVRTEASVEHEKYMFTRGLAIDNFPSSRPVIATANTKTLGNLTDITIKEGFTLAIVGLVNTTNVQQDC